LTLNFARWRGGEEGRRRGGEEEGRRGLCYQQVHVLGSTMNFTAKNFSMNSVAVV